MSDPDTTGYPEVFRARARFKRVNARELIDSATPGHPDAAEFRLDAALAMAEARGLEMVADEIEEALS